MNAEETSTLKAAIELHKNNSFQLAFNFYSELIKSNPNNYEVHYLIGILLIQNGLHDLGLHHLKTSQENELIQNKVEKLNIFEDSAEGKFNQERKSINTRNDYPTRDFESVDAWRHLRMLDFAECLANPSDHWLTIGDAYGHDAKILKYKGIKHVTASNLDASFLKKGHSLGEVGLYKELNAEKLDLPDGAFEYVLCKEALHHMPRPYLAIYEMLRVSKKGVFFIEPQDSYIDWPARKTQFYREIVKDDLVGEKISFRKNDTDEEIIKSAIDWWEDGAFNYVYTFSKREIRKITLGLGIPFYGMKCFNDYYENDIAKELIANDGPGFTKTKQQIDLQDKLCSVIGKSSAYITGLLFKQTPSEDERKKMLDLNYEFAFTPTRYLPIKWPNI